MLIKNHHDETLYMLRRDVTDSWSPIYLLHPEAGNMSSPAECWIKWLEDSESSPAARPDS